MKNMVLDFFKSQAKPKVKVETSIALIAVEILFVPGFGTKRLQRKAGIRKPKNAQAIRSKILYQSLQKKMCMCLLKNPRRV